MKALILAAGIGLRLGGGNGELPKCLLRFGGKTLLQRHIEILEHFGVSRLIIGVGYESAKIIEELHRIGAELHLETVFNPDFDQGNIVTLWRLRKELRSSEEVLLMDADVLYDNRLMQRLVTSDHANCFLMDRAFEPGHEPVKVRMSRGRIVEFRKQPNEDVAWDQQGESIGFFKLSPEVAARLAEVTETFIDQGRLGVLYEEALREIVLERNGEGFGVEDITGLPWIEIDYRQDVERAEREIFPLLEDLLNV